jgi:hypothetical protein
MATPEQKAFCVLQFAKHESVVSVHRAFRRQFQGDPPSANGIRRWYQQFQTTGCLCKRKRQLRGRVGKYSLIANGSKAAIMDVIGFLCVSLGSSTVQLHDSLGSTSAYDYSGAG